MQRLKINEIFYSIQGESSFVGRPCVLVRLTGCQMRCSWCDSEHSFYEGDWKTLEEILDEVAGHGCRLVEVTGGEPLLQPAVFPLMSALCDRGFEVLLETGGGIDIGAVDRRVHRIVDVKCPGSGESENNHWPNLDMVREQDELKFVLLDRRDYEWARELIHARRLDRRCQLLLSPVSPRLALADLAGWVLEDRLPVRLQSQLHKTIWGPDVRGV
jgi:7-carboxy-7-deazaguanine synthase